MTRRVSALVTLSVAVAATAWGCSDKPKQATHQHGQTSATASATAAQTVAGGHAGHEHAGHGAGGAGGADETIPKDQSGGALTKDKKFFE